jgi:hypothetical protein
MAVTAQKNITIQFTGDIAAANTFAAANNAASPGQIEVRTLAIGATTITPPGGGTTPKSVTIVMPSANTATLTLKGIGGDTGVVLHPTDPTTIALNSPTTTFVLTASAEIAGVRLIWT